MLYRPHIDGLRAVAIVPVLLFHADLTLFPGGFTGVDVFFVISGFLITSLIVEEIGQGRFTIWNFYKRRVLRILPAYLVVIAAVLATSWFTLFPDETRALGRSVAAASLFVSNIYFWRFSGYFDPDVEAAPLLHTWTLSVEEQYYILLPVSLILVARYLGRRYALALVAVSVASFVLSLWAMTQYETAAFYMLPTRAWEFGLGSLAAVTGLVTRGSPRLRGLGAAAGAALIAWGVFGLSEESVFPGVNAIFPALGAMLLIAFAEGNPAGRVLSSLPFVAIGKISYSLYLWHWPIIVFWKMQVSPVLDAGDVAIVVALSLVVAALSFRYVEEPFRRPEMRRRPAVLLNSAALASLALAASLGAGIVAGADRWGGSYPPELVEIASYVDYRSDLEGHPCFIHARVPGREKAFDTQACLAADAGRPTLLVLGDSHADHLMPAMEEAFPQFAVRFAGATGCAPTIASTGAPRDVSSDTYCSKVMGQVLRDRIPRGDIDIVVFSARWMAGYIGPLRETVTYLLRYVDRVVILGPTPEYRGSFPMLLARDLRRGRDDLERFLDPKVRVLDRQMAATDWGGARYVSLYDLICRDRCRLLTAEGVPYLADYGHYTRAAAREVAADLARMHVIAGH
jgi:peptidoglycan/LPS O-acetylase OafA/YrhL